MFPVSFFQIISASSEQCECRSQADDIVDEEAKAELEAAVADIEDVIPQLQSQRMSIVAGPLDKTRLALSRKPICTHVPNNNQ